MNCISDFVLYYLGEGKSSIAMEAAMNLWEKGRYLGGVFQVDLTGNCLLFLQVAVSIEQWICPPSIL